MDENAMFEMKIEKQMNIEDRTLLLGIQAALSTGSTKS